MDVAEELDGCVSDVGKGTGLIEGGARVTGV